MPNPNLELRLTEISPATCERWRQLGKPDRGLFDLVSAEWSFSTVPEKLAFLEMCGRTNSLEPLLAAYLERYEHRDGHVLDSLGITLVEYARHVLEVGGVVPNPPITSGLPFSFYPPDVQWLLLNPGLDRTHRAWLRGQVPLLQSMIADLTNGSWKRFLLTK